MKRKEVCCIINVMDGEKMLYMAVADLHGNASAYEKIRDKAKELNPDKLFFLGDFGGEPAWINNVVLDRIYCPIIGVQGNNDSLAFMESVNLGNQGRFYTEEHGGRKLFFTHGHLYGRTGIPPVLGEGDIIFYGHYHFPELYKKHGVWHVCVGSAGLPAIGTEATYCLFDGEKIRILSLDTDETVVERSLE